MEYSFKRGFKPEIERIREALEETFPAEIREEGEKLVLSYEALKRIEVWIEGKKLNVVTESDPQAKDETILETNKRFRDFLEKATGYTAKQRMKKAKDEAKGK